MSRFVIFLSLYISIYGSAHLYLLIKARRAFYLNGFHYLLLVAIFTFLLLAPINARLLESQGQLLLSVIMAWIGFVWMGFVFIFVCLALPMDGYHFLVGTGQQLMGTDWTSIMLSKRQSIALIGFITLAVMVYGAFEAYQIKTEKITLRTDKISEKTGRIRIVQISDVHIGPMFYPGRLSPILGIIKQAKPDILVSTGDLIDGPLFFPEKTINDLQSVHAPLGKYAVTGNHEYYTDLKRASYITKRAGFTLLRNACTPINDEITITGVDDPTGASPNSAIDEAELLGQVPDHNFSLLLKHRPEIDPHSLGKFDLQLSGHTHMGQIFPFGWIVRLIYPLSHGISLVAPDQYLYINRGTGTWGPPMRVMAPPEITIIDVLPNIDKKGGADKTKHTRS